MKEKFRVEIKKLQENFEEERKNLENSQEQLKIQLACIENNITGIYPNSNRSYFWNQLENSRFGKDRRNWEVEKRISSWNFKNKGRAKDWNRKWKK